MLLLPNMLDRLWKCTTQSSTAPGGQHLSLPIQSLYQHFRLVIPANSTGIVPYCNITSNQPLITPMKCSGDKKKVFCKNKNLNCLLFSTTMFKTHFSLCLRGREAISIFKAPLKISQITQLFVYNQRFIPPIIFQKILQLQIIENTKKKKIPDLETALPTCLLS